MRIVENRKSKRIFKNCLRLFEINPMNSKISRRFLVIPSQRCPIALWAQTFLQLIEKGNTRILIIQFRELPHDFAASLILQMRDHDLDRDDLVAALTGMGS